MDAASRAALDQAERNGYLRALRAQARAVCVPFWWHGYSDDGQYRILRNGTASFIDTGSQRMAVTADHVLAQYLADQRRDQQIVCQFGSATVDIASRVLDRDAEVDVATIEVSEVLVGTTGASFHAPPTWPPAPLAEGEVVLCCGFPGKLRQENIATADLPFQWFIGRATTVSAHNISLHLDLPNLHVPLGAEQQLNPVLGGMSGGPVFRFVPAPIEHLVQVGIIYQYHESYELLLARPVHLLRGDGTVAKESAA